MRIPGIALHAGGSAPPDGPFLAPIPALPLVFVRMIRVGDIGDLLPRGVDHQFRFLRHFVGRGDAGKVLDLSSARALVEALGVAGFTDFDIGIDEDFVEGVAGCLTGPFPVCAIR